MVTRGTTYDSRLFAPYIKSAIPAQSNAAGTSISLSAAFYIAGGTNPTWTASGLSALGLSINASTGLITGTLSGVTGNFSVTCTNSIGFVTSASTQWAITGTAANNALVDWTSRSTAYGVQWSVAFPDRTNVDRYRWDQNHPDLDADNNSNCWWESGAGVIPGYGCVRISQGTDIPPGRGATATGWCRPFSPFQGDPGWTTGMPTPDFNNNQSLFNWTVGWYGHRDYWASWPGRFLGDEFWLQFRYKPSANRSSITTNAKNWRIAKTYDTPIQEIVQQSHSGSPNRNVLNLYSDFGANHLNQPQQIGSSPDWTAFTDPPYPGAPFTTYKEQMGGLWDATCGYPNNNDPARCFAYPADEWTTVLLHIKAGHFSGNPVADVLAHVNCDTQIEVFVCTESQIAAGDATYKTVITKNDFLMFGDSIYPQGWQAFQADDRISDGGSGNFTQRYDQVIFSHAPIRCPLAPAPAWFTAQTPNRWYSNAVANTIASVYTARPGVSGPVSEITNAWCPASLDQSTGDFAFVATGGHGTYNGNQIHAVNMRSANPAWACVWGPSGQSALGGGSDAPWGPGNYGDGNPRSAHNYQTGVAAEGRFWRPGLSGMSGSNGNYTTQCFSIARSSCNGAYPPNTNWTVHGAGGHSGFTGTEACHVARYDPIKRRIWVTSQAGDTGNVYSIDVDPPYTIRSFSISIIQQQYAWAAVIPNKRWIVFSGTVGGSPYFNIFDLTPNDANPNTPPTSTWRPTTNVYMYGNGVYHAPSNAILVYNSGMGTNIQKLTLPSTIAGAWTNWSTVSLAGGVTPLDQNGQGLYSKFEMVQDMGNGEACLVLCPRVDSPVYTCRLSGAI